MNKEVIIGIDLGTTNSVVSYVKDGRPKIVPIDGEQTMPSCVGLTPDGKLIVGREARNQYTVYPERTVLSIKRKMGLDCTVPIGDQQFRPEEISALILKKLKAAAEAHIGSPIAKAVITVPAYFDEKQRKATRDAGEIAGLNVVNVLNEPTAAALAYNSLSEADDTALVYDLGGGTFDASLVVNQAGVIEVKSSHGDTQLGGDDFDQLLMRRANDAFMQEGAPSALEDSISRSRLKMTMEAAKIELSSEPFVNVEEAFLLDGKSLQVEISREDYQNEIYPLLEKTIGCCAQCLNDAGMKASDLNRILLVGGSSRTPLIYEMLQHRFNATISHEINSDLVVAYGAGLQAASIAGIEKSSILVDITPHNLGVLALDGYGRPTFSTLIPRNSPLPARQAKVFFTVVDNQEAANVEVFQGGHETLDENKRIGELKVTGLSPLPEGNEIVVNFQLNLNGMLELTATERKTGLAKKTLIDTHGKGTQLDIEATSLRLNTLAGTDEVSAAPTGADGSVVEVAEPVAALRKRANLILSDATLDADDRTEINEYLAKLEATNAESNRDEFEQLKSGLEDVLFFLEQ